MIICQADFYTIIGRLYYLWRTAAGRTRIIFLGAGKRSLKTYLEKIRNTPDKLPIFKIVDERSPEIEKKINCYLGGRQKILYIEPEFLTGSDFEKKVWEAAQKIPFGTTVSYGRLAEIAGFPSAARAVGNALGKNPVFMVVPCHRVIKSDNTIGGFSSGVSLKEKLLRLEKME